jgi:hypothetical protein
MRVGEPIPTSEWSVRNLQGLSAKVQQEVEALYEKSTPEVSRTM